MDLKIIYSDKNLLVVDKPAGIRVDEELMDELIKEFPALKEVEEPPRYGLIHRLDKDTSGIVLVAKTSQDLFFFQKQFKQRRVEKKYLALVSGTMKQKQGIVKSLIGRDKNSIKQKVYLSIGPESKKSGPREAETHWRVIKEYKNFSLIEASPKTGRKHQVRVHLAYIHHPVVGDKLYSFKNALCPQGLTRQFLHAEELRIKLPNHKNKIFISNLPEELKQILKNL